MSKEWALSGGRVDKNKQKSIKTSLSLEEKEVKWLETAWMTKLLFVSICFKDQKGRWVEMSQWTFKVGSMD